MEDKNIKFEVTKYNQSQLIRSKGIKCVKIFLTSHEKKIRLNTFKSPSASLK